MFVCLTCFGAFEQFVVSYIMHFNFPPVYLCTLLDSAYLGMSFCPCCVVSLPIYGLRKIFVGLFSLSIWGLREFC